MSPSKQKTGPIQIDQIIRSRRKTLELQISAGGKLIVRAPQELADSKIQALVEQKAAWIRAKQQAAASQPAARPEPQFKPGEVFYYLGRPYPLQLVNTGRPALRFEAGFYLAASAHPQAEQHFIHWYRQQARQVLTERVAHYSRLHGFQPRQVKITSARTRWGSCSSKGVLSFPWRLVMAPLEVIDYVVLHELVHLKVRNHSRQFWSSLQGYLPDYQERREWLRTQGNLLEL